MALAACFSVSVLYLFTAGRDPSWLGSRRPDDDIVQFQSQLDESTCMSDVLQVAVFVSYPLFLWTIPGTGSERLIDSLL